MLLDDKSILITGGTGSFGKAFTKYVLVPPVIKMDLSSNNIMSSLSKLKIPNYNSILYGKTKLLSNLY
jgi:FlaA1/EpsC-like NDP-sugar epimerase